MIEVESLWPTTLVINQLDNINNKELSEWILDCKKSNRGRLISNIGGWQLEVDEHEKILKPLHRTILETIKSIPLTGPKEFKINFWVNVNTKGDWNIYHDHMGVDLSGVYYVKVPENSGEIMFKDPRKGSSGERNVVQMPLNLPLMPKEGVLLMFPPFLEHMVSPSKSDEERISIAYNVLMRDPINN